MGLVNTVVPLGELEDETLQWCREMLALSPDGAALPQGGASTPTATARSACRSSAGNATLLYYLTEEAQEGANAFVEKRKPDFTKFPRFP